ncbi:MAG TPA: hypothetical protein VNY29_10720 [Terriglobales bacterium]|jgi:hypothetical protein|nr:hypothetical protein [Terriglobales bacterium]
MLKSTCVLSAIAFPGNGDIFHWDKELWAIRTVTVAGIGTSASVIYP